MQVESLTRDQKIEAIAILEEKVSRMAKTKYLSVFDSMYDWQKDFVRATKDYHECCLCAANQIGKTYTGTDIDAMHLLGDYPEDWGGHEFSFPPLVWGLGYSIEKTRDLLQTALFGKLVEGEFEGGLVPKDRIISKEMASGTPNAVRTVRVKHKYGISTIQFWSYTQGQHAIMGDVVDWFHVDEEPKDQTIRPQLLTRTINGDKGRGGRGIYTFTPENGRTELVIKFMDDPASSQFFMMKGWEDAPHMTKEKRERLLEQYPEHQRDMRTKGIPMLGHGRIYDISDDFILCDPFDIPDHWNIINGMDFGWDHPQGHVQIAEDPDTGTIYLMKSYKASKTSANDAWAVVRKWGANIPVAWPADGLQHEKGREDAVQQKVHYSNAGFSMLPSHATWPDTPDGKGGIRKGGNSVEQGIYNIIQLASSGRFKVFRGNNMFMDEWRQYHRDEKGRIVKKFDDLLDSVRYAYMMLRFSVKVGMLGAAKKTYIPSPLKSMSR